MPRVGAPRLEEHRQEHAASSEDGTEVTTTSNRNLLQHLKEQQDVMQDSFKEFSSVLLDVHSGLTRMEAALNKRAAYTAAGTVAHEVAVAARTVRSTTPATSTVARVPSADLSLVESGSLVDEEAQVPVPPVPRATSKTTCNSNSNTDDSPKSLPARELGSGIDRFGEVTVSQNTANLLVASVRTSDAASMIKGAGGALLAVGAQRSGDARMGPTGTNLSSPKQARWKRGRHASEKRRGSMISQQGDTAEQDATAAVAAVVHVPTRSLKPPKPFTEKAWFRWVCGLIIMVDSIVIAIETDDTARHGDVRTEFFWLGYAFSIWYVIEIAMRICMTRPLIKFFTGKNWAWNLFDTFLIFASVTDIIIQQIEQVRLRAVAIGRALRAVRLFRVIRVLRLIRFMTFMREFHKLVLCLASSLQTLACAMSLMTFVIFCFSILFVQMVSNHVDRTGTWVPTTQLEQDLDDSFGTVGKSMISLYAAITSGRNWNDISDMLFKVDPALRACFLVYLAMGIFGLTNVVTAVFVESAMQATQNYRDLLVNEMILKERTNVKHMKEIFKSIDADDSGAISLQEMQAYMSDESLHLQDYFEALDLSASDTETLFKLLDVDGSGEVDVDEFCDGCMRLGGPAKSFDMNCMWYEQRRTNREVLKFIQHASLALHSLTKNTKMTEKQTQDLLKAVEGSRKVLATSGLTGSKMNANPQHNMYASFSGSSNTTTPSVQVPPPTNQLEASLTGVLENRGSSPSRSSPFSRSFFAEASSLVPVPIVESRLSSGTLPSMPEDRELPNGRHSGRSSEVWGWL